MRKQVSLVLAFLLVWAFLLPVSAAPARIKDIAKVQGVRDNQLIGYGLVVGLSGTGDSNKSLFTNQAVANMMQRFGITVDSNNIKLKNVAAVMVTAKLPSFAKDGDTIDMTVSSMGDAKSIAGGTLLQTPLKAANGQVYAVGQGPISTGGFSVGGGGASQRKNFPTAGNVPGGAIVERATATDLAPGGVVRLSLMQPDFTTASRIADSVNRQFGTIAAAADAGTVNIIVPPNYETDLVPFIARIEDQIVYTDNAAKVVINERTGTVVMGGNVTIDEVAVAQGGLTVKISKDVSVSQPAPFSGGQTVVTEQPKVDVQEKSTNLIVLPTSSSVSEVVSALNAVGASANDVISILQAMKAAGALHAELQLI